MFGKLLFAGLLKKLHQSALLARGITLLDDAFLCGAVERLDGGHDLSLGIAGTHRRGFACETDGYLERVAYLLVPGCAALGLPHGFLGCSYVGHTEIESGIEKLG